MKNIKLSDQQKAILEAIREEKVWFSSGAREWQMLVPKHDDMLGVCMVEKDISRTVRKLKDLGLAESKEVQRQIDAKDIPQRSRHYSVVMAFLTPAGRQYLNPAPIKKIEK